jgi:hypothetical protein
MGLMQFDGITFDNVDDLLKYKREMNKQREVAHNEQPEEKAKSFPLEMLDRIKETLEKPEDKPKKIFFSRHKKRKYLSDFDEEIKHIYSTKLTKFGRVKRKALRSLARKIGCKNTSITCYAIGKGYVHYTGNKGGFHKAEKTRKWARYTQKEKDYILNHHKTQDVKGIADHLGTTTKRIYNFLYRHKLNAKKPVDYMKRRKPVLPESFDQKAMKQARTMPERKLQIYPLTPESNETLKSLLLDARQRGSGVTYNIARANLSLLDGREWTLSLWDDVCQQIMRSSAILSGFGISVMYAPQDGRLSVFKAK